MDNETMDREDVANYLENKLKNPKMAKKIKIDPAWHDEDDDISDEIGIRDRKVRYQTKPNACYQNRLEEAFPLVPDATPDWAIYEYLSENSDKEDDKDDFKGVVRYGNLPLKELQFERCTPLNMETRDEGSIIRSIKFNPVNSVALVAGDNTVNMIRVKGGKSHPLLQKIILQKSEIKEITWSYSSTDFYVTIRKERSNWFRQYNVETSTSIILKPKLLPRDDRIKKLIVDPSKRFLIGLGNSGNIHVLSETTKEYIGKLRMSDNVNDATFSSDGRMLYTYGGDGEIFVWDMNQRQCITEWHDDNHRPLDPLSFARCSEYTAFGCESGIVNVYSNSDFENVSSGMKLHKRLRMPQPKKEFKNLTTAVTSLVANSQSELLAVASNCREGGFRLLHLPSMTTFQNFETGGHKLGRVNCVDFSPGSGYLALGNNKGSALLYRLKHYAAY